LIEARAKGNPTLVSTTRTKLLMKGIKVDSWDPSSPDDPAMLVKVRDAAKEMGIAI
jgi:hypothetical protein